MPTLEELADTNIVAVQRISAAVTSFVERAWWSLTDWHDPDSWMAQVLPVLRAGQVQTAAVTDAYLAAVLSEMTGEYVEPVAPEEEDVTELRIGVSMLDAYRRPFHQVWWRQSEGDEFPDALRSGLARAKQMTSFDLQLAKRQAAQIALMSTGTVTHYRRVLSGDENCETCTLASQRTFFVRDLMAIHANCDCTVMPVIEGLDPALNLNLQRAPREWQETPKTIQRREARRKRRERNESFIKQHGELGPVLTD